VHRAYKLLTNRYLETAFFTRDTFEFSTGDKIDIKMPADLDQLRRDNSHSAVVGGKGLVELGHDAPDSGAFFQKTNIIT